MAAKLPVEDYIDSLKSFLRGDLQVFHNASSDAETKEATLGPIQATTPDTHSMAPGSTSSSTTTPTGTSFSGSQSSIPQPPQPRGTIPTTLALFATMDFLGFLWGTNAPGQQNTKNLKQFLNRSALDKHSKEALIDIYRHGMVHGFFPKSGLAISYHSNNPKGEFFFGRNGNIVLNVEELELLVLGQLSSIPKSDFPAMNAQYTRLVSHYQIECAPVIAILNGIIKHY